MKAKITTSLSGTVSYTALANHLSTTVSELPEYHAVHCHTAAVKRAVPDTIKTSSGTVHTGHHKDWYNLSHDERKMVKKARESFECGGREERMRQAKEEGVGRKWWKYGEKGSQGRGDRKEGECKGGGIKGMQRGWEDK